MDGRLLPFLKTLTTEWKKLVAKTSMHAIYDDHDFGMDDCVPDQMLIIPHGKGPCWQIL